MDREEIHPPGPPPAERTQPRPSPRTIDSAEDDAVCRSGARFRQARPRFVSAAVSLQTMRHIIGLTTPGPGYFGERQLQVEFRTRLRPSGCPLLDVAAAMRVACPSSGVVSAELRDE